MERTKPYRVLSLDGGGIRGLYTFLNRQSSLTAKRRIRCIARPERDAGIAPQ